MTEESYPFPASADDGQVATADRWRRLNRAALRSGVIVGTLPELGTGTVTSATDALAVDFGACEAQVEGFHYRNTATLRLPVPTAHPSLARIDRLVLRLTLDPSTGSGKIRAYVAAGTPGGPAAPPVRTATTYDIPVGRWTVGAGSGRAGTVVYDLGRYARSGGGAGYAQADGGLPVGDQDSGAPWVDGDRVRALLNGMSAEYVWVHSDTDPNGGQWCIAPGQLVARRDFTDLGGRSYAGGYHRIGEVANGSVDSQFRWNRPALLPGRGLDIRVHLRPLTSGQPHGDLITVNVWTHNVGPVGVPFGYPLLVVTHGIYGPTYNSTAELWLPVAGYDSQLAAGGSSQLWSVQATCGNGVLDFRDGSIGIYSS